MVSFFDRVHVPNPYGRVWGDHDRQTGSQTSNNDKVRRNGQVRWSARSVVLGDSCWFESLKSKFPIKFPVNLSQYQSISQTYCTSKTSTRKLSEQFHVRDYTFRVDRSQRGLRDLNTNRVRKKKRTDMSGSQASKECSGISQSKFLVKYQSISQTSCTHARSQNIFLHTTFSSKFTSESMALGLVGHRHYRCMLTDLTNLPSNDEARTKKRE